MTRVIQVFSDAEAVSIAAAEQVVDAAQQAIAEHGAFYIALSGGSTPKRLYQHLASENYRHKIEWSKVHIFFGDERCVAGDHPDSNYRMASEAFLDHVNIPASQIHRIQGESDNLSDAANEYAALLEALPQKNAAPQFDLILLGMGDDGHTASLFPKTTTLTENDKSVVALQVPQLDTQRITMTYKTINNAQQVMFLIAGTGKASRLEEVLVSAPDGRYPVQGVQPRGTLSWILDEAAAEKLPTALLQ